MLYDDGTRKTNSNYAKYRAAGRAIVWLHGAIEKRGKNATNWEQTIRPLHIPENGAN